MATLFIHIALTPSATFYLEAHPRHQDISSVMFQHLSLENQQLFKNLNYNTIIIKN